MAQCEEQGFSGVTSDHFGTFLEKAEQYGIPGLKGQGNSGEASKAGVTIRWNFNPDAKQLTVQCTESPMFMPCGMINSKINELVSSVLSRTHLAGTASAEPTAAPAQASQADDSNDQG